MQYSSSSESLEASASNSPRYQNRAIEAVSDIEVSSDIGNTLLITLQIQSRPRTTIPWSTGLFDCFSDIPNCCMTCWCPCITFGHIAEILDKGSTSCGENGALYGIIACAIGCPCYYSCFYRSKLRQQFKLRQHPQTPCSDCFVHCFCELCALCQEYRQLKHLGHDMSMSINGVGRHQNSERRNGELAMSSTLAAPSVQEGMSR